MLTVACSRFIPYYIAISHVDQVPCLLPFLSKAGRSLTVTHTIYYSAPNRASHFLILNIRIAVCVHGKKMKTPKPFSFGAYLVTLPRIELGLPP